MQHVIAVVGPTGSGKSDLAQSIALTLGGEVLSCDSMQVYNELNIGTAKLSESEMLVPHHGISISSFAKPYSASLFQKYARSVIDSCFERNVVPVACGGSGLYLRAALDVMEFPEGEQVVNPIRTKYEDFYQEHGAQALYELLLIRDPEATQYIHANNVKRVIRALEMADNNTLYSDQVKGFSIRESYYPTVYIGLRFERELLYKRINERVLRMLDKGLLSEVEKLYASGLKDAITASQAIGYKELFDYIEGKLSYEDAISSMQRATRRYAKRQLTWFRSDDRISWIDCDDLSPEDVREESLKLIAREN